MIDAAINNDTLTKSCGNNKKFLSVPLNIMCHAPLLAAPVKMYEHNEII